MTGKRVGSPSSENISEYSYSKEQDRFLPIANVGRIMKKSLPSNAKVSKEAKETVQECVSEFISFVTGEASDKCQREKRKTINGDDLLWAMTTLGFENYVGLLKIYLNKYRETEGEKKSMAIQEEQPLPNTTNSINDNHDLHGSNHDYYALGAQVTKKSYGDHGYGDKLVISSGFNIHELGDGNAKRAMAAHFHHGGVEW